MEKKYAKKIIFICVIVVLFIAIIIFRRILHNNKYRTDTIRNQLEEQRHTIEQCEQLVDDSTRKLEEIRRINESDEEIFRNVRKRKVEEYDYRN